MSQAEDRSWWADVQHLRPDARTAAAVVSIPEPADAPRDADPLLAPAPGRRFVRSTTAEQDAGVRDTDTVMTEPALRDEPPRRRIVLLGDVEGDRAVDHTVDVDFDFGRAAEDRARRRTAERLGMAQGRGSRPASGQATAGSDMGSPASTAPARIDCTPSAGPARAGSAAPAGPEYTPALAPVPLAPPPPRGGVLGRRGPARRAHDRRPRRPRSEQVASQPDRIALWAVLLGIFLIAIAAASSRADAATPGPLPRPAALEQTVAPASSPAANATPAAG